MPWPPTAAAAMGRAGLAISAVYWPTTFAFALALVAFSVGARTTRRGVVKGMLVLVAFGIIVAGGNRDERMPIPRARSGSASYRDISGRLAASMYSKPCWKIFQASAPSIPACFASRASASASTDPRSTPRCDHGT